MRQKSTTLMRATLGVMLLFLFLVACATTPGDEPVAADPTPTAAATEEAEEPDDPVSSDDPTPTATPEEEDDGAEGEMLIQDAVITGLQIMIMESWPLQASVQIDGELGDGCTELEPITTEREGDTFFITVKTARPADAVCTLELRFFSETVPLDIEGLEAGTYTVDVNGVTETFTLDQDNVASPDEGAGEGASEGEMSLSLEEQAELVRLTLERALVEQEIPDYALLADQDTIVLSTENIDAELVPEIEGVPLELLTPEEIQARADESGDFVYLNFDRFESNAPGEATVSVSSRWAVGADSEMIYLSGGGFTIEYTKLGENWVGEITETWIS